MLTPNVESWPAASQGSDAQTVASSGLSPSPARPRSVPLAPPAAWKTVPTTPQQPQPQQLPDLEHRDLAKRHAASPRERGAAWQRGHADGGGNASANPSARGENTSANLSRPGSLRPDSRSGPGAVSRPCVPSDAAAEGPAALNAKNQPDLRRRQVPPRRPDTPARRVLEVRFDDSESINAKDLCQDLRALAQGVHPIVCRLDGREPSQ